MEYPPDERTLDGTNWPSKSLHGRHFQQQIVISLVFIRRRRRRRRRATHAEKLLMSPRLPDALSCTLYVSRPPPLSYALAFN